MKAPFLASLQTETVERLVWTAAPVGLVRLLELSKFSGQVHVVATLDRVFRVTRYPKTNRLDQGSEFTSRDMDFRAYQRGVVLDFSRQRKPTDHAFIEAFDLPPGRPARILRQRLLLDAEASVRNLPRVYVKAHAAAFLLKPRQVIFSKRME